MPDVLVPLAQGCEELEAVTIIDLLRRAEINVISAGLDEQPVTASRSTILIPDTTLAAIESQSLDMVVLPGGLPGADNLNCAEIHLLLQRLATQGKQLAAICAAPRVLLTAGLLDGKRITCYPGSMDAFDCSNTIITSEVVVVDGNITTSRGPGTAMDFALTLIEQLTDSAKRNQVEAALTR